MNRHAGSIRSKIFWTILVVGILPNHFVSGIQDGAAEKLEFFESRIRPVLIEHCYKCHNSSERSDGDLSLDYRDAIRDQSESGTAVVPFKPDQSLLLNVIRHEIDGKKMPKNGGKFDRGVVVDFEKWIRDGAVDPRDEPPSADALAIAVSWETTLAKRKQWWSFQPIVNPELPVENDWSNHPIDRFVHRRLVEKKLLPNDPASKRVLIRRLSFALTGLPPTTGEVERFENDEDPNADEKQIDRLLASPRFGERWARHWMDLVRYADSHGSEGDPAIPNAFRYRDYLIRAFNADVPYDQLLHEHVAGDLLSEPRINNELGINESAIGTAHWRFVFHGFAPTDALDEKVRFTDDQINVFGKAFMGLTISCARCHDHKFDAISQKDYYALFGILGSCPPLMQDVNVNTNQAARNRLASIKERLRKRLALEWIDSLERLESDLADPQTEFRKSLREAAAKPDHVLNLFTKVQQPNDSDKSFRQRWSDIKKQLSDQQQQNRNFFESAKLRWDLGIENDFSDWYSSVSDTTAGPASAGSLSIDPDGTKIASVLPAGFHSNFLTRRTRAVLMSPKFKAESGDEAWLLVRGGGQASIRYVVQNYPRNGTVFPINQLNNDQWYWHRFDLDYWQGDDIHLEFATAKDAPLVVGNSDRSWFGVRHVLIRKKDGKSPPSPATEPILQLVLNGEADEPADQKELARKFVVQLKTVIEKFETGSADITNLEASFLNACARDGLLANSPDENNPELIRALKEFSDCESTIPLPVRVPGIAETGSTDQPLLIRGDHRKPGELVPRRFLEAIDATPYKTNQSGRLELANDLLRSDNPLIARVAVNRIWIYLFGKGLVSTPDNFGKLGTKPTHPELLDYLAARMVRNNWSIKETIRFILTSRTWQMDSVASTKSKEFDPDNRWLSHANLRRLDAEAIRDSMLAVSGQLDETMYGPGFPANQFNPRRSVYVVSRRNSLDEFLQRFDSPVPFSTTGRRSQTNVPAQSLTMLNDPFVNRLAADWSNATGNEVSVRDRIDSMFQRALSRKATPFELDQMEQYVQTFQGLFERETAKRKALSDRIIATEALDASILEPVRRRLTDEATTNKDQVTGPEPFANWQFETGIDDTLGILKGKLHGDAKISNGLVVAGAGHLSTSPIQKNIGPRTLEIRVALSDLAQRGGGVMTIQDLAGNVFDSIVFGEQDEGHWMAGSNGFARTQPFGGRRESDSDEPLVHFAIAYDADGTVRGYRNGEAYGKPVRKGPLHTYNKGQCQIVFGLRHGQPGGNRMLKGVIKDARLYDRALSPAEIAAAAQRTAYISRLQILAELTKQQREEIEARELQTRELKAQLASLGAPARADEAWAGIAHAIFNLKEFIYVQ